MEIAWGISFSLLGTAVGLTAAVTDTISCFGLK
jgi:hypothetical protein